MYWLIDYLDYGYISIDTEFVTTEIENDPEKANIENCFTMENDKLNFKNEIYIRRFYWEDFNHLQSIFDKKCMFTGNKFYIINKSDQPINTRTSYLSDGTDEYLFTNSNGSSINLIEEGKSIQLNKPDHSNSGWYLHKIMIDLREMNLSPWYYDNPRIESERSTFIEKKKLLNLNQRMKIMYMIKI